MAYTGLVNTASSSNKSISPGLLLNDTRALQAQLPRALPGRGSLALPRAHPAACPVPAAAEQSSSTAAQKALGVRLHTHRDVQTHAGEEGREVC